MDALSQWSVEQSVYQTVAFFDKLDFCLTAEEISERLMGDTASSEEVCEVLASSSLVDSRDGYFFLPGREELVQLRKDRMDTHALLMRKVERYRWVFRIIPGLRAVYVCNRLAIAQARPTSDIDLFVITVKGRLFTTRFFLLFTLQILGLRIHPDRRSGRFCPSFIVDETQLNVQPLLLQPRDPYFAYWVLLLKPIVGHVNLRAANPWLRSYFSEEVLKRYFTSEHRSEVRSGGWLGDMIEAVFKKWQMARLMKKYPEMMRPQGLVISDATLKLHEDDRRHEFV